MRKSIADYLNNKKDENTFFLHADMFPYRVYNEINPGVQEPHLVNLAAGLAENNATVYIYGVCGFVIHKAYEQMRLSLSHNNGCVIFLNAGFNGCYSNLGKGHTISNDLEICQSLNIPLYHPKNKKEFLELINYLEDQIGVFFVRLGYDNV